MTKHWTLDEPRHWIVLSHEIIWDTSTFLRSPEQPNPQRVQRIATYEDLYWGPNGSSVVADMLRQYLDRPLDLLVADQRRILLLFAVQGLSQEEAAQALGCRLGTVKSRVSRARKRLAHLTGMNDAEEIGQDQITKSVLTGPRAW